MTEQERIHEVCSFSGRYQTLPFVCVATGAQPSVVVKEILDRNWLGTCHGINAVVVVTDRAFRTNSYQSAIEHMMLFYDIEDTQFDMFMYHVEWFLTQYTADLLLGGAESKRYSGWDKLDKYEEVAIRNCLGPGYPKRVVGLDSKLKIQYGRR